MSVTTGLEWTFDSVFDTYEKMRPGYVEELYQQIFAYAHIDCNSQVVEIGIGGGQATEPMLKTGCQLTAVEYGENFTRLCKEKFQTYPNFSILTGKFEEVPFQDNSYDLVYSASAFHWIPEEIGYPKVYSMLKSGGVFARFANRPSKDQESPLLTDAIDKLYEKYYYKFYAKKHENSKEFTEELAKINATLSRQYGFTDTCYYLFHRTRTFSAKEYIALLGTYSDHIAITEDIRLAFFSEIEQAINDHGGKITIYDTIDLELGRKE